LIESNFAGNRGLLDAALAKVAQQKSLAPGVVASHLAKVAPIVAAPIVAAPIVAAPIVAAPIVAAPIVAAPIVASRSIDVPIVADFQDVLLKGEASEEEWDDEWDEQEEESEDDENDEEWGAQEQENDEWQRNEAERKNCFESIIGMNRVLEPEDRDYFRSKKSKVFKKALSESAFRSMIMARIAKTRRAIRKTIKGCWDDFDALGGGECKKRKKSGSPQKRNKRAKKV
jgi:hypothetical protein